MGPKHPKGGQKQRNEESKQITLMQEELDSFSALKKQFLTAPVLAHFDPTKPIRLETDASLMAISGILSQPGPMKDEKVQYHPVAYFSRKMIPAERNYDTHDQELLAIVESFKHWRHYLEGAKYQIELNTDHANLIGFMSTKVLSRRQVRWAEWLATFDFKTVHKKGKLNPADAPSRRPDYSKLSSSEANMAEGAVSNTIKNLKEQLFGTGDPACSEDEPNRPNAAKEWLCRTTYGADEALSADLVNAFERPNQVEVGQVKVNCSNDAPRIDSVLAGHIAYAPDERLMARCANRAPLDSNEILSPTIRLVANMSAFDPVRAKEGPFIKRYSQEAATQSSGEHREPQGGVGLETPTGADGA